MCLECMTHHGGSICPSFDYVCVCVWCGISAWQTVDRAASVSLNASSSYVLIVVVRCGSVVVVCRACCVATRFESTRGHVVCGSLSCAVVPHANNDSNLPLSPPPPLFVSFPPPPPPWHRYDNAAVPGLSLSYSWTCFNGTAATAGVMLAPQVTRNTACTTTLGGSTSVLASASPGGGATSRVLQLPANTLPAGSTTILRLVVSTGTDGAATPMQLRASAPRYIALTTLPLATPLSLGAPATTITPTGVLTVTGTGAGTGTTSVPSSATRATFPATAATADGSDVSATVTWWWQPLSQAAAGVVVVDGSTAARTLVVDVAASGLAVGQVVPYRVWAWSSDGAVGFTDVTFTVTTPATSVRVCCVGVIGVFGVGIGV